ncbi:Argininosuccinate lyase (plasmid) [Xanthobacter versatilis]|uniref:argininosuccinate lyase n=1 Tax=Xanthobacter autotrophicus (strain ATCC BAA-1158 / Py2) TaxID=78245 RepID=A7IQH0_XANP2|nr:Argininosuccinate lyase [Xanthobacter autotrophicus Py2]
MAEAARGSPEAVLEIGNRLLEAPSERLVASAFAEEVSGQDELFRHLGLVVLAHCITLTEQGVIPPAPARLLVAALIELQQAGSGFVAEAGFGDLYTNREAYLTRVTPAVGWFGTSRARREALTTAYHLSLRERLTELGLALVRLGRAIVTVAETHVESVMPDYTYLQAAQPTSFGRYLSGFAWPALRDLQRLEALYVRVDLCPAGCGSINGSVAFQDRAAPLAHARDAMWQADLTIEAIGLAVAAVVGLDRIAEDLMSFATAEFGFVRLSDRHGRASKIMPQKRNPFVLAFVRGGANRLIGEQAGVAASGRMDSRMLPYVAAQAALLMAEVITELSSDNERARAAIDDGITCASDLAERLCLTLDLDFRTAHGVVGRLIGRLESEGRVLASLTEAELQVACRNAGAKRPLPDGLLRSALDPACCLRARGDVGGAAPREVVRQIGELACAFRQHEERLRAAERHYTVAEQRLIAEALAFTEGTA